MNDDANDDDDAVIERVLSNDPSFTTLILNGRYSVDYLSRLSIALQYNTAVTRLYLYVASVLVEGASDADNLQIVGLLVRQISRLDVLAIVAIFTVAADDDDDEEVGHHPDHPLFRRAEDELYRAVESNPTIQTLSVNLLGSVTRANLAHLVQTTQSISRLFLTLYDSGDWFANQNLAESFRVNETLRFLDIDASNNTEHAVTQMLEIGAQARQLEGLCIKFDCCEVARSRSLRSMPMLVDLEFRDVFFEWEAEYAWEGIRHHETLRRLTLERCDFNTDNTAWFESCVSQHTSLTYVVVGNCSFESDDPSVSGGRLCGAILATSTSLEHFAYRSDQGVDMDADVVDLLTALNNAAHIYHPHPRRLHLELRFRSTNSIAMMSAQIPSLVNLHKLTMSFPEAPTVAQERAITRALRQNGVICDAAVSLWDEYPRLTRGALFFLPQYKTMLDAVFERNQQLSSLIRETTADPSLASLAPVLMLGSDQAPRVAPHYITMALMRDDIGPDDSAP